MKPSLRGLESIDPFIDGIMLELDRNYPLHNFPQDGGRETESPAATGRESATATVPGPSLRGGKQ